MSSEAAGKLTVMNGNDPRRWIIHDPNGHYAGAWQSQAEAIEVAERWNSKGGHLVTVEWTPPPDEADDSDRGTYTIRLEGANIQEVCCGWHSMEASARIAGRMRDFIARVWDLATGRRP